MKDIFSCGTEDSLEPSDQGSDPKPEDEILIPEITPLFEINAAKAIGNGIEKFEGSLSRHRGFNKCLWCATGQGVCGICGISV